MSKPKRFLTIGVWVAVLPFLGFPIIIKNILFVLTGLLIIYLSYGLYLKSKMKKEVFESFSENEDFIKKEEEN